MKKNNSGRKPVEDKKIQICLYVKKSEIEKLGGAESLKKLLDLGIKNLLGQ